MTTAQQTALAARLGGVLAGAIQANTGAVPDVVAAAPICTAVRMGALPGSYVIEVDPPITKTVDATTLVIGDPP